MKPRPTSNPDNRFARSHVAYDEGEAPESPVQLIDDASKSILSRNDSPDIAFEWSVNPYRGCVHACAYCYARPYHEYLGMGAGTDHDTKIVVKRDAAGLLREAFDKPSWKGDLVVFSGVTDCYQPTEAKLGLTRACLEVCAEYRNPVGLITKAPLVERDLDLLVRLSREARVEVRVSIPFIDAAKARAIEPWVATPQRRLETIRRLADAGVTVGVNVAPVIPGLNDDELPAVLEEARGAGAARAGWVLLRLPGAVAPVFEERLRAAFPDRADRVMHLVRETRGGELYDVRFGARGRGTGLYATTIAAVFDVTARRLGFDRGFLEPGEEGTTFRRPPRRGAQLSLFGD
jgi:DNA repair photolyase